jgi:hypothetical protein
MTTAARRRILAAATIADIRSGYSSQPLVLPQRPDDRAKEPGAAVTTLHIVR